MDKARPLRDKCAQGMVNVCRLQPKCQDKVLCEVQDRNLQSLQAAEAIDDCRHVYRHALPVRWMKVPLSLAEPGEMVAGLSGFWFTVRSIS